MNKKIFLTYDDQLEKLRTEKQLSISDSSYAQTMLQKLSYYSLIDGYKTLFKHAPSGKYLRGVTFDELIAFYFFDEELRTLFLKYILHVERHMKSIISYHFCEKYGENQNAYLSPDNYTITRKNTRDLNRLIDSIKKSISLPSHYTYITHYVTKYNNVPLWVAMNALTFGQISKFYQYITNDIQGIISSQFKNINERQLHQFIRVLASCRNVCAHGERLFSFHINENIPDTPIHNKLQIPRKHGQYVYGKHDLFSVVIALKYLISPNEFKIFKSNLLHLITSVIKHCPHLTQANLLSEMGFPENWNQITRYKN